MFFKNSVIFLPLLLSGCGVSVLAHSEYMTFSDVDDKALYEREMFRLDGLNFRKVYSNQKQRMFLKRKQ